mmetsp:Transcript_63696/g.74062  ORF Transcript_63696/g.74062 Transcript_63696/m.74062 type:complete len:217 (+) Transcript_63696:601-1251(+)
MFGVHFQRVQLLPVCHFTQLHSLANRWNGTLKRLVVHKTRQLLICQQFSAVRTVGVQEETNKRLGTLVVNDARQPLWNALLRMMIHHDATTKLTLLLLLVVPQPYTATWVGSRSVTPIVSASEALPIIVERGVRRHVPRDLEGRPNVLFKHNLRKGMLRGTHVFQSNGGWWPLFEYTKVICVPIVHFSVLQLRVLTSLHLTILGVVNAPLLADRIE